MNYWESEISLSDLVKKGIVSLGRGRIISSIDLQKNPGIFPVYSSSSQKGGLFGLYNEYDFNEELLTWSVDGGGYFFYRPKHKFSVTNVSGILKVNEPIYDYKFLYYSLVYQHSKEVFDYVDKAHPSVIKKRNPSHNKI
ncbi:restriction endonuclease subunit S [Empedobacter falsenii]